MKNLLLVLIIAIPAFTSACATSLEKIVDANHRARIDAANANQSLARGAADGLGTYIAQSHEAEATALTIQH
jgi:hypothetical protein